MKNLLICLLLLLPSFLQAYPSKAILNLGSNEDFVLICGEWHHIPPHTPTLFEYHARRKSDIPDTANLIVTFYIGCEGELYQVRVSEII